MEKIKRVFADRRLAPVWLALVAALFFYATYSFKYEFWDWSSMPSVGLYAALSGVCFGLAFLLLWTRFTAKKKLLAFLLGVGGYETVLWITLTLVNVDGKFNHRAIYVAYGILYVLFAAVCLIALWKNAAGGQKAPNRALAVILAACFIFCAAQPILPTKDDLYMAANFTDAISYVPISADEIIVTAQEADTARRWFDSHVLLQDNGAPAFDFTVDGERFSEHTADWNMAISAPDATARRGGETYTVTGKHACGLSLSVEATFYQMHATCEWTVYLENTGKENSPVIGDFCALSGSVTDASLGKTEIYCNLGSHNAADDFTPLKVKNAAKKHTFTGVGGRPSDAYMPFFNLCGESMGAVIAIGWTGEWQADLQVADGQADVTVKQQTFEAYLTPGETVRTPLVSLSVYVNPNPVKGFNTFRNWVIDCVYPEETPAVLDDLDVLFVSHTRTAQEIVNDVNTYDPALLEQVDNFWMDAGWYAGCKDSWSDGNGNWTPTQERFPNGIKEISDLAATYGSGLVLWYEPERLVHGSYLYEVGQEHPEWIIDTAPENEKNGDILWNLADDGARQFLAEFIGNTLKENGVAVYRQDFNTEPLEKWEYADAHYYGGRKGICENRYVSGLYAYLDYLLENVPGLIMDNCASGGRRLDLEMTRRSIPLWRSDYNCDRHPDSTEATQAHTYGLSFWQPVSGVNVDFGSEYGARSSIFGGNVFTYDSCLTEYFGAFEAERRTMVKNFYPISFGGVDAKKITAMQYGDDTDGEALIYKHKDAASGAYAVVLSGLSATASYTVYDTDASDASEILTGAQLMRGAFTVDLPEGEKAVIVKYAKQ